MKPPPRFKWDIDITSHWRRWINIPRFNPPPHPSPTPSSFISLQRTPDVTKRGGVTQSTLPINFQKTAFGCPGFSFPAVLLKLHNYCVQPEKHTWGLSSPTPRPVEFDTAKALVTQVVRVSGTARWNSTSPLELEKEKVQWDLYQRTSCEINRTSSSMCFKRFFPYSKKRTVQGMGNSGIHTNKP